jgi:hypothetical protein
LAAAYNIGMKRILALLIIVAAVAGAAIVAVNRNSTNNQTSQLTGEKVSSEQASRPILAIVLENSPPARPQTGLSDAGIVFETVTEGGITRYLAFYQENMPDAVGPVRSLRPYFVDWTMGFDAAVAHVGGSPQALDMAKSLGTKDLNQFKYPDPYYRDSSRQAPHNMYAHTQQLRDLQKKLGYGKSNFDGYPRKNDRPSADPSAADIVINYSSADYKAEFRYQPSTNSYIRYLAGSQHVDAATGQPITVKNVVVLKMSGNQVNAVGDGDAEVFYDGQVVHARWHKSGHNGLLQIQDNAGRAISLNRGSTWFAVLPAGHSLTF